MYDYLVTGADGYLGSHYTQMLLDQGNSVIAVVRRTSKTEVQPVINNMQLTERYSDSKLLAIATDLSGPSALCTLANQRAKYWVHLAAEAYVPASIREPATVFTNNLAMTVNVLEAFRISSAQRLYVMSSSEIYGSHENNICESALRQPTTPYAASKLACEELALSYYRTYELPVVIGRAFNSYGPYHRYDVIPVFISRALRGENLLVNGDGLQQRDFTYASDTIAGIHTVINSAPIGSVYNIGTGVGTTILSLANKITTMVGSHSEIEVIAARKGEVRRLVADTSHIQQQTGWRPKISLDEGLESTIDFLRSREGLRW